MMVSAIEQGNIDFRDIFQGFGYIEASKASADDDDPLVHRGSQGLWPIEKYLMDDLLKRQIIIETQLARHRPFRPMPCKEAVVTAFSEFPQPYAAVGLLRLIS